ncbi:stromal cell-derived factor 1-like isoform X4 [Manis javanica]|uniref:stromal cell-derived factor 1-like isoform X4 n=1 Tax=Manis javanica TaxID=9974 RepID=UPI003C6CD9F6
MDAKVIAVLAPVLAALCLSDGKPVSLSYRCPCRFFESHIARGNIKHLKILNTPNCALQIVARLKNNNRQVCIDLKLKWIQEYLEKALNKGWTLDGSTSVTSSYPGTIQEVSGPSSMGKR